jgi:methylenetetrahydrofolate dehydrogenase (NADP+)/methenyltetrahydrofolate cyclohydrolase
MSILLDGKATAASIRTEIAAEVQARLALGFRAPHLVALIVGNNPASETYVANKVKACQEIGFRSTLVRQPSDLSEEELIEFIDSINKDEDVDGLLVQLPLPAHLREELVIERILPEKDVDGFHPQNIGRLAKGLPAYLPATPYGILELLKRYELETTGKHCVVVGRSNIVGSPISMLMARNDYPGNATVTLTHSKTQNLASFTREADILIAAIGRHGFITADMVKEGAVVIDVGINSISSSTTKSGFALVGDVDFEAVAPKCLAITPVPKGVGPMTIAMLLQNTLDSAKGTFYPKANQ